MGCSWFVQQRSLSKVLYTMSPGLCTHCTQNNKVACVLIYTLFHLQKWVKNGTEFKELGKRVEPTIEFDELRKQVELSFKIKELIRIVVFFIRA